MLRVKEILKSRELFESDVEIVQIELKGSLQFRSFFIHTTLEHLEDRIITCGKKSKNKVMKKNYYLRLKQIANSTEPLATDVLTKHTLNYICIRSELAKLYVKNHQGSLKLAVNIYDASESYTEIDAVDDEIFAILIDALTD